MNQSEERPQNGNPGPDGSVDPSVEWQDGAIQSLYGVGLKLENCIQLLDEDPEGVKPELESAIARLNSLIRELRNRIFNLAPLDPERQDFSDALADLLRELSLNTLINVGLLIPPGQENAWERLSSPQRRALLDVARCALANVREHSRARRVRVELGARNGRFFMKIDDDGIGMNTAEIPARPGGLLEMRELAAKQGGTLRLASSQGEGTSVQVEVPLEETE